MKTCEVCGAAATFRREHLMNLCDGCHADGVVGPVTRSCAWPRCRSGVTEASPWWPYCSAGCEDAGDKRRD